MARKYEEGWKILKHGVVNSTTATVRIQVSLSKSEQVIRKHASTAIRGMQKEKYNDANFRRQYAEAQLTSEIDFDTGTVTLTLNVNADTSLADI